MSYQFLDQREKNFSERLDLFESDTATEQPFTGSYLESLLLKHFSTSLQWLVDAAISAERTTHPQLIHAAIVNSGHHEHLFEVRPDGFAADLLFHSPPPPHPVCHFRSGSAFHQQLFPKLHQHAVHCVQALVPLFRVDGSDGAGHGWILSEVSIDGAEEKKRRRWDYGKRRRQGNQLVNASRLSSAFSQIFGSREFPQRNRPLPQTRKLTEAHRTRILSEVGMSRVRRVNQEVQRMPRCLDPRKNTTSPHRRQLSEADMTAPKSSDFGSKDAEEEEEEE